MPADVCAHITGTIWQIRVNEGDAVEADQELAIIESMKMEMPVVAPCGGRVKSVHAAAGQAVSEGDLLVIIE